MLYLFMQYCTFCFRLSTSSKIFSLNGHKFGIPGSFFSSNKAKENDGLEPMNNNIKILYFNCT